MGDDVMPGQTAVVVRFSALVVVLAASAVLAMALTACGGDDESVANGRDMGISELPVRPEGPVEIERVALSWETPDGELWPLDVVAPVDSVEGGWPVLVTFHGAALGTSASDMAAVARSGVVVVGPRWAIPEWTLTNLESINALDYVDGAIFDVAKCALASAQEVAVDHGGNPDWTTVEGFSAGVHPAAWVGLGIVRDDPCRDADIVAPIGLVLGDSNWLFKSELFDGAFDDDSSPSADTVDRFLNPNHWKVPDRFVAYLWSSESTVVDRPVENPPAEDSWLPSRGGDDIIDDLDAIGAFDDESIGFLDSSLLQADRMRQAGFAVLHEQLLGDHSRNSEMIDRTIEVVWQEPLPSSP